MRRSAPCTVLATAFAALLIASSQAQAFEDRDFGVYVEGGQSLHGADNTGVASVGVMIPWTPRQSVQGGALSFYWDVFASQWRAPSDNGHRSYSQLGVIATWRYRFDHGNSPWFAEGGIGGSVMDRLYRTPDRKFSTTFQFTEVIGAGYSFGQRGQHELSLRLQHFSNAGIKKPNPGENFARVRYAYRF